MTYVEKNVAPGALFELDLASVRGFDPAKQEECVTHIVGSGLVLRSTVQRSGSIVTGRLVETAHEADVTIVATYSFAGEYGVHIVQR